MSIEAGSRPMVFNPEKPISNEEQDARLKKLAEAMFFYCRDTSHSDMEKGAIVGKLSLKFAEDSSHRRQALAQFKGLCEAANKMGGRDTHALYAGFLGELASADLFHNLDEIDHVKYPTIEEDQYASADWFAKTKNGRDLLIQTKTVPFAQERGERQSPIPVLSSLKTIEDLNAFIQQMNSLCATDIAMVWSRPGQPSVRMSTFTPEMLADSRNVTFSAAPDENMVATRKDFGGSKGLNSIEKICKTAAIMCWEHQKDDYIPVMCVLGSANSKGSDINTVAGTPSPDAMESAREEIKTILRESENL